MEGHVNGNRVMCLSPAGKEVPQIPEGQGEPSTQTDKSKLQGPILYPLPDLSLSLKSSEAASRDYQKSPLFTVTRKNASF